MLQTCSRGVFRCFKWMERAGDAITGYAGPVFVSLAWCLLIVGVVTFFQIIAPTLPVPLLSLPLCLILATNLLVHYYWACTVPPGTISDDRSSLLTERNMWFWAQRSSFSAGVTWSEHHITHIGGSREPFRCRKCSQPRPERAHHCSVCKFCVLKYDHHCPVRVAQIDCRRIQTFIDFFHPRINQCVGLHNERHFVLFMAYLVLCCGFYIVLGWDMFWVASRFTDEWKSLTPRVVYIIEYVLALALGLSVGVMLAWQLHLISVGETSVESYDNARYVKVASQRGTEFVNSLDLGWKKNLMLFFNIGRSGYSLWTLFLPVRCPPYTDGWNWARRPGMSRHSGINDEDELTDED